MTPPSQDASNASPGHARRPSAWSSHPQSCFSIENPLTETSTNVQNGNLERKRSKTQLEIQGFQLPTNWWGQKRNRSFSIQGPTAWFPGSWWMKLTPHPKSFVLFSSSRACEWSEERREIQASVLTNLVSAITELRESVVHIKVFIWGRWHTLWRHFKNVFKMRNFAVLDFCVWIEPSSAGLGCIVDITSKCAVGCFRQVLWLLGVFRPPTIGTFCLRWRWAPACLCCQRGNVFLWRNVKWVLRMRRTAGYRNLHCRLLFVGAYSDLWSWFCLLFFSFVYSLACRVLNRFLPAPGFMSVSCVHVDAFNASLWTLKGASLLYYT